MNPWAARRWASVALMLLVGLGAELTRAQAPANQAAIEWKVEAGFAPLAALPDVAVAAAWMPQAAGGTLESFAQWYDRVSLAGRSPYAALLDSTDNPWDAGTSSYRSEYARPTRVAILARALGAGSSCRWTLTAAPGTAPLTVTEACASWQRFEVPLAGARLSVTGATGSGSAGIDVDHKVIVGLGDSYGSGEGNPDVPTQWMPGAAPVGSYRWLSDPGKDGSMMAAGARWWDTSCHRSFWSHQSYVALRLAAENPHRFVTFLHYACSAAEVFDGVMVRQHEPPGMDKGVCKSRPPAPDSSPDLRNAGCYLPASQLAAMVSDLCYGEVVQTSPAINSMRRSVAERAERDDLYRMDTFDDAGLHLRQCLGQLRQPDLILLSIGGNDIGFGSLAGWAITPPRARSFVGRLFGGWALIRGLLVVCPATGRPPGDKCRRPFDSDLIEQIPARFELLSQALTSVLTVDPKRVVVTAYPDPLRDRLGAICGDPEGYHPDGPWAGAYTKLPLLWLRRITRVGLRWDFNIREREAKVLSARTLRDFGAAVAKGAELAKFGGTTPTGEVFVGHCWTEKNEGDAPTGLPSARPTDWSCTGQPAGSPSCWKPFAASRRFIRTINDALLTQSSARSDDMTGAVHPTAQGHAAVADRVLETTRMLPSLASSP